MEEESDIKGPDPIDSDTEERSDTEENSDAKETGSSLAKIQVPRLFISSTRKSIDKSAIVIGLLIAYQRTGLAVAAAKVGSSLVDTVRQRRVSGRLAHSLDPWMLSSQQMRDSFVRLSSGAELVIIEGDEAVFDSFDQDFSVDNEAEIADLLKAPVVLVFDADGLGESIAALVKGFAEFHPTLQVAGAVAAGTESEEHNTRLKNAVEALSGARYLGGIPKTQLNSFSGSQVALTEENPSLFTRTQLIEAADLVESHLDLSALREIAEQAGDLEATPEVLQSANRTCRIAVADDQAFHVTVQDNLDLIRRAGGEIKPFSPLADLKLPSRTRGIYLPSGYVQLYASDLSHNTAILQAIRDFAIAGGSIYAEGTSLAYLCRSISLPEKGPFDMAGVIPGVASLSSQDHLGTGVFRCEVTVSEPCVLSKKGQKFRGMREPRWALRLDKEVLGCLEVVDRQTLLEHQSRGEKGDPFFIGDGLSPHPQVVASTVLGHWGSKPDMAKTFVKYAARPLPQEKK